jgi:hypothetical protein
MQPDMRPTSAPRVRDHGKRHRWAPGKADQTNKPFDNQMSGEGVIVM